MSDLSLKGKRVGESGLSRDGPEENNDEPITNIITEAPADVIAKRRIIKPRRRGNVDEDSKPEESALAPSVEAPNMSTFAPLSFSFQSSAPSSTTLAPGPPAAPGALPLFNFGSSSSSSNTGASTSSAAPASATPALSFSFAPTASPVIPAFSFSSTPAAGLSSAAAPSSAAPFSFSFPSSLPQIQVGVPAKAEGDDEEGDDEPEEEEEVAPKVAAAGEENELIAFEDRAKIFTQNDNGGWEAKPVGKIRINVDKTTKKARMLYRVESAAKEALLNAYLFKQMSCLPQKDGKSVRFLVPGQDGKPAAYLLRFAAKEQSDMFETAVKSFNDPDVVTDEALKKLSPEPAAMKEKKPKKDEKAATAASAAAASTNPSPFGSSDKSLTLPLLAKGESFATSSIPAFINPPSISLSTTAPTATEEKVPTSFSAFPGSFAVRDDQKPSTLPPTKGELENAKKKDETAAPALFAFGTPLTFAPTKDVSASMAPAAKAEGEKQATTPAPSFVFGAPSASAPKEEKKEAKSGTEQKPMSFSFTPLDSKKDTSAASTSSAPAPNFSFSFNNPIVLPSAASSTAPAAGGFNFAAFAFNPNSAAQAALATGDDGGDGDDDAAEEAEPEIPKPKAAGEEGEVTIYAEKSKLFSKSASGKWEPVATGETKVNVDRTTRKTRILVRKDSAEKEVVLNAYLFARIHCKTAADGKSVTVILVGADGTPAHWLLRFSKPEHAAALQQTVDKFKDATTVIDDDVTKAEAAYNDASKTPIPGEKEKEGIKKEALTAAAHAAPKVAVPEDKKDAATAAASFSLPAFNLGAASAVVNASDKDKKGEKKEEKNEAVPPLFTFGGATGLTFGGASEKKDAAVPSFVLPTGASSVIGSSSSGSKGGLALGDLTAPAGQLSTSATPAFGFAFGSATMPASAPAVPAAFVTAPPPSAGFSFGGFGTTPVAPAAVPALTGVSAFGSKPEAKEEKKDEDENEAGEQGGGAGDGEGEEDGGDEEGGDGEGDGEGEEDGDDEEGDGEGEGAGEGEGEGESEGEEENEVQELPQAPLMYKRQESKSEEVQEEGSSRAKRNRGGPAAETVQPAPLPAAASTAFNFRTALAAPSAPARKSGVLASSTIAASSSAIAPTAVTPTVFSAAMSTPFAIASFGTPSAPKPAFGSFGSVAAPAAATPSAAAASTVKASALPFNPLAAFAASSSNTAFAASSPFSVAATPTRATGATTAPSTPVFPAFGVGAPAFGSTPTIAGPSSTTIGFMLAPPAAVPSSSTSEGWKCVCCETSNSAAAQTCGVCLVARPKTSGAPAAAPSTPKLPFFGASAAPAPSPITAVRSDASVLASTPIRKRKEEEPSSTPVTDDKKKAKVELFSPMAQHEQWKCAACGTTNVVGIVCGNPSCLRMRLV